MTRTDRIEREIHIEAPVAKVWTLVTRPGWWIGDGDPSVHTFTEHADHVVVHDPTYGDFPIHPAGSDEPHYVAFRSPWDTEGETLVEFFLTAAGDGTHLRVVESGFAALKLTEAERDEAFEGNTKGWEAQLGHAKRMSE